MKKGGKNMGKKLPVINILKIFEAITGNQQVANCLHFPQTSHFDKVT